ncbi:LPS export ABC transporter permease LptF [Francisella tularensis]|uniref:Lipopolysaccharide export system permease protein LptF n=4 Tax=Francisella tularensis TaxID=263 RepID=A0A6B0KIB9_FRATU|nr:LPS export ABC transporter permease LptF [Francisella tularensis]AFX71107.1 putative permease, YjgP/YjgQ family protein [Francisella tularensis subsp. holarctica F92]ABU62040.1 putative permease, YjgP/YjgQ family protein [Francisella tularensis subsp. holarctica FTNF002-00]AJI67698.1 LPS export ABC transporter permease LptF [Francisella tularensis subsp. holarctica]AKO68327.1 permease [Francisella tularensis subsp. holarctica]AUP75724.1 LPS export ABC transporter permease LptF [Francisella 
MILEKYYNKDIVNTFTSITLFIISIVSANLLIRLFQEAYSQGLGIDSIVKFVILTIPENVSLVAPIAIFLAIIICFGKYFANNEMFVTIAGGITWMQIVKNTLKPVVALTIITLITVMYLNPLSKQTLDIYRASLSAKALLSSITDQKIIKAPDGKIIHIGNKSGNTLSDVFLYQNTPQDGEYKVMTAPTAKIVSDKTAAYIDFMNVNIYTKNSQNSEYSYDNAKKAIYTIFDNSDRDYNHNRVDRLYMHTLIENFNDKNNGTAYKAEFLGRINNAISVIVSSLLALALCRLRPRQNKYAKLLPSVVVLAIYLCTNMFINTLMANSSVPVWIGFWLPHIFFTIFAVRTIRKDNGSSKRKK